MEAQSKTSYQRNHVVPTQVIQLERGKVPPQATDLEQAILGALMIDKKADEMFGVFNDANVFYAEKHQYIFQAILNLSGKNEPIDLLTVSRELKVMGFLDRVGDLYLIELTQKISSSAHIEMHSRIVLQMYMRRQAIHEASLTIERAYDDTIDVFDMLDATDVGFTAINEMASAGKRSLTWDQSLDRVVKNVEMLTAHGDKILGVHTGFWKMDAHLGGWQPTDFHIIAARPGAGKTALTVAMMLGAAQAKVPVGYLSMEMSSVQMATRAVAVNSSFHMNQLTRSGFEKDAYFETLLKITADMKKLPIHIDDTPALSLMEIRRRVRQMVRRHGIKVLFLDYLQLAAGGGRDVRHVITELCYGLKALAKELEITIIGLSQLSRDVEKRSPPRPRLSDLAESAAIEASADGVMFIYSPGYYKLEPDYSVLSQTENTEIIVAKYRHGGVGTIGLWYDANKTKFTDDMPEHTIEMHQNGNDNWEQTALNRSASALPTPSANEAFGGPENNNNVMPGGDDMPF